MRRAILFVAAAAVIGCGDSKPTEPPAPLPPGAFQPPPPKPGSKPVDKKGAAMR